MAANPFDLIDPPIGGAPQPAPPVSAQGEGGGKGVANPFDLIDPEPTASPSPLSPGQNAPYSPVKLTPGAIGSLPLGDQLKRSMGLFGRDLATAGTALPMAVADAVNAGSNIVSGQKNLPTSQQFQQLLTQWGLPTADTQGEKLGQFGAQLVGGAMEPSMRALQAGVANFGPKQPFPSTALFTNEFGTPNANAVKADTIKAATDLGYVSTPSISGSGPIARGAEAFANKPMIEGGAMKKNQNLTDVLSRQIGLLKPNANITPEAMDNAITGVWEKSYKPIQDLKTIPTSGPNSKYVGDLFNIFKETQGTVPNPAIQNLLKQYNVKSFTGENAIKDIRMLRDNASKLYSSDNVDSQPLAKAYSMLATSIEDNIQNHLNNLGKSGADMLAEFKAGRATMSQQYAIKDAIVKGTGSVDLSKLGTAYQAGAPFTGALETMAKFANTAPQLVKSPSANAPQMFSNMERGAGMYGLGALMSGKAIPAMAMEATGYPLAALGVRSLLKSPMGQRMIAPNLNPGLGARAAHLPYVQNAIPTAFNLGTGLFGQQP